jgi:hypothetical protein
VFNPRTSSQFLVEWLKPIGAHFNVAGSVIVAANSIRAVVYANE